jgi:hypothetical protein
MEAARLQSETWKSQHATDQARDQRKNELETRTQAFQEQQHREAMEERDRAREESRRISEQMGSRLTSLARKRSEILSGYGTGLRSSRADRTRALQEISEQERYLTAAMSRAIAKQSGDVQSVRRSLQSQYNTAFNGAKAYSAALEASRSTLSEVSRDIGDSTWDGRDSQWWITRTFWNDNREQGPEGQSWSDLHGDDEDSTFWQANGFHRSQWATTRSSLSARLTTALANQTKNRDPEQVAPIVDKMLSLLDQSASSTASMDPEEVKRRVDDLSQAALSAGINPQALRAFADSAQRQFAEEAVQQFGMLKEVDPDKLAFLGPLGLTDEDGNLRPLTASMVSTAYMHLDPETQRRLDIYRNEPLEGVQELLVENAPTLERMNALVLLSNAFDRTSSLLGAGGIANQADLDRQAMLVQRLTGELDSQPRFTEMGDDLDDLYSRFGEDSGPTGMSRETLVDAMLNASGDGAFVPFAASQEEALAMLQSRPELRALVELIDQYQGARGRVSAVVREAKTGRGRYPKSDEELTFGDATGGMEGLEERRRDLQRSHIQSEADLASASQSEFNLFVEQLLADPDLEPEAKIQLAQLAVGMTPDFGQFAGMEMP